MKIVKQIDDNDLRLVRKALNQEFESLIDKDPESHFLPGDIVRMSAPYNRPAVVLRAIDSDGDYFIGYLDEEGWRRTGHYNANFLERVA